MSKVGSTIVGAAALACLVCRAYADTPRFKVEVIGTETPAWSGETSAQGQYSGTAFTMSAAGHDFYWCWDRGGFAYVEIEGDFTFSCRLKSAPDVASKVGIGVREKLFTASRAIDLRFDYYHSPAEWTWYFRKTEGAVGNSGSYEKTSCNYDEGAVAGMNEPGGIYMRIERTGGIFRVSLKESAGGWQAVKDGLRLATDKVLVGLTLSSGSRGAFPATAEWDEFVLTTPTQAMEARAIPRPMRSTGSRLALYAQGILISSATVARSANSGGLVHDIRGRRVSQVPVPCR